MRLTRLSLVAAIVLTALTLNGYAKKSPATGTWRDVNNLYCWVDLREDGTAYGWFTGHTSPRIEMKWEATSETVIQLTEALPDGTIRVVAELKLDTGDYVYSSHRFRFGVPPPPYPIQAER